MLSSFPALGSTLIACTAVFVFIGTLIPWSEMVNASPDITIGRLFGIGILILLFRRLPWVLATYKFNPAIENMAEAVFTGWFGPIGEFCHCELKSASDKASGVGGVYYASFP